MSNIDKIDQKIIFFLQQDGKLTNFELAEKVGLSPSPCLRRVKTLEQKGLIAGSFETVEEAQAHLLKLAANMVASLAVKAREQARAFEKPVSEDQELPVPEEEPEQNKEPAEQSFPEPAPEQPPVSQSRPRTPRGVQMITLPDGTRARVHLPADMQ